MYASINNLKRRGLYTHNFTMATLVVATLVVKSCMPLLLRVMHGMQAKSPTPSLAVVVAMTWKKNKSKPPWIDRSSLLLCLSYHASPPTAQSSSMASWGMIVRCVPVWPCAHPSIDQSLAWRNKVGAKWKRKNASWVGLSGTLHHTTLYPT